jgi:predicted phage-related endonuclease
MPDRSKFLGGSDVAAIFGVSPWKTPYDLFLDKTTPRSGEEDLNEERRKFFAHVASARSR